METLLPVGAATTPLTVEIRGVFKSFARGAGRLAVLHDLNLTIPAGQFAAVLGPSGSGKSTLLAILAGLEAPDQGVVTLTPRGDTTPLTARLGHVGYMPQRDLLLPWRTALDNATVALEVQGLSRQAAQARALPLFEAFGLDGFARQYPHELSGGMRQRVSFLRSALSARGLMLLDEPFGALDALTRAAMQEWLLAASARLPATFVLVTHDVDEAVLLADRVTVLSPRPARVVGTLDIALPRPRSLDSLADPRFAAARAQLLDILRSTGGLRARGGQRA
jgi:ABC-type nitrate/sulfonate/bicarbonate transport system ATPase subunit